jgi:hypothetical protein
MAKMLHSCGDVFDRSKVFISCRHHLIPIILGVAIVAEVLVATMLLNSISQRNPPKAE